MFVDEIFENARLKQSRPKLYAETYKFWQMNLLERVNNLFKYGNLPESIPQREIEFRLHMAGQAWVSDDYDGSPRVFWCNAADTSGIYLDMPKTFNFYSGTVYSGDARRDQGVHGRNNDYMIPTKALIDIYADKLAHADLTLVNVLVNMRAKNVPVSASSKLTTRLNTWFRNIYSGKQTPIEDPSYSALEIKQMDMGASMQLRDLAEVRENIINEFYNSIGIRQAHIKKAQMTDNEVEAGDAMLLLNVSNMLECRKEFVNNLNNFFGLSVTVDYCDELKMQFDYSNKEVSDNGERDNSQKS